ncbi:hypothetical protein B0H66DRAFT_535116 [Apodospora peruviana]|uniref:Ubiquitin-like protease family profile domain-containing protein n=1 Tax=Apodospora peruviana TaxID=516989 RepID=A0AAE0I207_9PEZI|nr:hypothetical protein B0H66DRAFT_535116 [Apodospora peruviana]
MALRNITKDNFLSIDTILIPICSGCHWTLAVVHPNKGYIAHIDSMLGSVRNTAVERLLMNWVCALLNKRGVYPITAIRREQITPHCRLGDPSETSWTRTKLSVLNTIFAIAKRSSIVPGDDGDDVGKWAEKCTELVPEYALLVGIPDRFQSKTSCAEQASQALERHDYGIPATISRPSRLRYPSSTTPRTDRHACYVFSRIDADTHGFGIGYNNLAVPHGPNSQGGWHGRRDCSNLSFGRPLRDQVKGIDVNNFADWCSLFTFSIRRTTLRQRSRLEDFVEASHPVDCTGVSSGSYQLEQRRDSRHRAVPAARPQGAARLEQHSIILSRHRDPRKDGKESHPGQNELALEKPHWVNGHAAQLTDAHAEMINDRLQYKMANQPQASCLFLAGGNENILAS